MDSNPTLHDFVLHLITNQDARLAFQLDPQGTLRSAGLGDLTPADVHDVVPLVVDLTPVRTVLPELGTGGLTEDPATAIGQLQHIVHQLPLANGGNGNATGTGGDVNVATLGAITATPAAAGIGTAATASSGIAAGYDVGLTLDAVPAALGGQLGNGHPLDIVTSPVGAVTGGVVGDLGGGSGFPGGINADPIGGVTGTLDDLAGSLTGGLVGEVTGGLTGDLTGGLTGGLVGEVTGDLAGSLTGGLTGDLTGGLAGSLTGDLTGGLAGGMINDLTGGLTGSLTGELTGGLTGHLTEELSGTIGGLTGTAGGLTGTTTPHDGDGGGVVGNVVGNVVGGITNPHDGGLLGGITDGLL